MHHVTQCCQEKGERSASHGHGQAVAIFTIDYGIKKRVYIVMPRVLRLCG